MAKRDCYIRQMVQTRGEDWVSLATPEQIQNQFKRIVKDMVMGNIDYSVYGKYFYDLKFMENLIIGITNELEINTLDYTTGSFYLQYFPETPNLGVHISHLGTLIYIYNTILEKLNFVKTTGDIGYLADISGLLFNYRIHLN